MQARATISADYLAQQQELHKNPGYGVASLSYAPVIKQLLDQTGLKRANAICGRGCTISANGIPNTCGTIRPCRNTAAQGRPACVLLCCSVLEHIEEPYLEAVLLDLKDITRYIGFFSVHTGPAMKTRPDGRNAHVIQKPSSCWLPRLCQHFEIGHLKRGQGGFWGIVEPKLPS